MKKPNFTTRLLLSLLFIACIPGHALAAPYGPDGREIDWEQPGGEKIKLRVFGDEYYGRTETAEGYTVIYDSDDGAYHYAELSADATSMKPSGAKAHLPPRGGQARHLDLPKTTILGIQQSNRARIAGKRDQRWSRRVQAVRTLQAARMAGRAIRSAPAAAANGNATPVIGNKVGLTILAQFPNDPRTPRADPVNFPATRAKIVNFCNQVGYNDDGNSGSVRDYFFDQSLGKVTYTQIVTEIVTLPHPRNYYNYSDYPANKRLRFDSADLVVKDAVRVLKNHGFDFSGLTTDDLNQAIATNVFFAGRDSGVWAKGLWPQQSSLLAPISVGTATAPIYISNYQITNISNSAPTIGTFVHENGHLLLDYPDLYSLVGEGVGLHCLMGAGNYLNGERTPAPINAYLKDIVGWANVTEISAADDVTRNLPTAGNIACRIRKPGSTTEFFVVENRGLGDKWAFYARDKGIAIWHVDESIEYGNMLGRPHYGVALKQADGRNDLERGANLGDRSDLFDLATPRFTEMTDPNSAWWDGTVSWARVKVLDDVGPNMRVQFGRIPADTILVNSPAGGEIAYCDSTFNITWEANITGNVKIDLYQTGLFHSTIATNAANSGKYSWAIPTSFAAGDNFSIRISSITNAKPVFDFSGGTFKILHATFPEGGRMPDGWYTPPGADTGWQVTRAVAYEGTHSLVSKVPEDGGTADVAYTSTFEAGKVEFHIKTSTEQDCDYARFFIDGVQQSLAATGPEKALSGEQPWTFISIPVSAGKHTFKWQFDKDDSYASGFDRVWLDGVVLPASTQVIAVSQPPDKKLKDGVSVTDFGSAIVGHPGGARTFTVKNTGSAALTGLKVSRSGPHWNDFALGALAATSLAPGESTTFKVTFTPGRPQERTAFLHIASDNEKGGSFDIRLRGFGLPKNAAPSMFAAAPKNSAATLVDAVLGTKPADNRAITTTQTVEGRKYLVLTVAKPAVPDTLERTVEVSPNLIDWFSGGKHTTVVIDNETLLKVRDNTPVTPGRKRYIRLKTTRP